MSETARQPPSEPLNEPVSEPVRGYCRVERILRVRSHPMTCGWIGEHWRFYLPDLRLCFDSLPRSTAFVLQYPLRVPALAQVLPPFSLPSPHWLQPCSEKAHQDALQAHKAKEGLSATLEQNFIRKVQVTSKSTN